MTSADIPTPGRVRGRSLEQVRRYDAGKFVVAMLLFAGWLAAGGPGAVPGDGPVAVASAGDASTLVPISSRLRIESQGGRILLRGSVADERTRRAFVAVAERALEGRDRVIDGLTVAAGAEPLDWLSHVGPAIAALAAHEGVSAVVGADRIVLEGRVVDEAQRSALADRVTGAFGAPFTVENRLGVDRTAPASSAR